MSVDIVSLTETVGLLLAAGLLALPIGWEREKADRPAGLRTFPVVALASCAYLLIALEAFPSSDPAQARILQGLLAGMGFIGGGAILKKEERGHVMGVATAASLWTTGAIGAAVAFRSFDVAVTLSLVNLLVLRFIHPVTGQPDDEH